MKRWIVGVISVLAVVAVLVNNHPHGSGAPAWRAFWSADGTPPASVLRGDDVLSYALTNALVMSERDGLKVVIGVQHLDPEVGGRVALLIEGDSHLIVAAGLRGEGGSSTRLPGRALAIENVDPTVVSVRVFDSAGSHLEGPFVDPVTAERFVMVGALSPTTLHGVQLLDVDGKVLSSHTAVG